MQTYGALHRGAGPHASLTHAKVHDALASIRQFVNASDSQGMVFTQNTSAAINLFARLLGLKKTDVILTTSIEHTSNNLPWHYNTKAQVVEAHAFEDGSLDYEDLEEKAREHSDRLKLIAITGAANQTGYIPDIKRVADLAHRSGAILFVDAAQLAPHRPIDMQEEGIDALAFSAHKIYAPFGAGVLVMPAALLDVVPADPGGGSIDMVSDTDVVWAPPRERHQTGTWNTVGIVALAESCRAITDIGWKTILAHEAELVEYMAKGLSSVPGLLLHVPQELYVKEKRIGTFPFTLTGYHHALVSAILENEFGIETRAGTICNHRLVRRWFHIDDKRQKEIEREIKNGNRLASYGIVRASLAIHNSKKDVDALVSALKEIVAHGPKRSYVPVPKEEIYVCKE